MPPQIIQGPQDSHVVRDGALYRDTRRVETRIWAFMADPVCSAVPLLLMGLAVFVPALFEIWLLIGIPYTAIVAWRLPLLPLRMPKALARRDPNFPDRRTNRPGKPLGDWLMFVDRTTRQPGFVATPDMQTHCIVAGTTGAGKTRTLVCKQANVVSQGSGFTMVDGKGSNSVWKDGAALARHSGREAELRVVNFLTSSGSRESHTWNPFAHANADGIKNLLLTLFIAEDAGNGKAGSQQFFVDRGMDLISTLSEFVAWARDVRGIRVNLRTMRRLTSDFDALRHLVLDPESPEGPPRLEYWSNADQSWHTEFLHTAPADDGRPGPPALPNALRERILNYMRETGGYSAGKAVSVQDKVREQHGYVVGGFGATFTQLSGSLGHIFDVDEGDIDTRDIIFNRRIMIAILPVLENDKKVNSRLGRFVINALRYGLAPGVGGQLSGDINEIIYNRISNAPTVYCFDFDELGMYAAEGLQAVLAQARDLNASTTLAFQEISSLQAALGKASADALLSNPRLHFIQSLNDNTATKDWVERSAPRVPISVNPGYQANALTGMYQDQGRADVREMPLFTWLDVTSQQPGQAIVTYYGRRIYAEIPNIELATEGYLRMPSNLTRARRSQSTTMSNQSPPPAAPTLTERRLIEHADALSDTDKAGPRGILKLVCTAYRTALSRGTDPDEELAFIHQQLNSSFIPRLVATGTQAEATSTTKSDGSAESAPPNAGPAASEPGGDTGSDAATPASLSAGKVERSEATSGPVHGVEADTSQPPEPDEADDDLVAGMVRRHLRRCASPIPAGDEAQFQDAPLRAARSIYATAIDRRAGRDPAR